MHSSSCKKSMHFESGPNMTPLVDVVMVILIFLMLAGSFGASEHYMATTLATSGQPTATMINRVDPIKLDLTVNSAGGVRVPGRPSAISDNAELTDVLASLLQKIQKESGTAASDVQLFIHASEGVSWDHLAPVYDAALRAKFEKIGFSPVR